MMRRATLERRIAAYTERARHARRIGTRAAKRPALLTSAVVASAATAGSADAVILYSGPQNLVGEARTAFGYLSFQTIQIDLDLDGARDLSFTRRYDAYYRTVYATFQGIGAEIAVSSRRAFAVRLFESAESITASADFGFRQNLLTGFPSPTSYRADGPFLLGVSVQGRLGWLRIALADTERAEASIVDWALETEVGKPIAAGAVPEPSTGALTGLGLLALGARGVRMRRARRAARSRSPATTPAAKVA